MTKTAYTPRAALGFFSWSVLCQVIGFFAGQLFLKTIPFIVRSPYFVVDELVLFGLVLAHGTLAFYVARWIRLPIAWRYFNLLIAPCVLFIHMFYLPQGLILAAFIISILIYLPTFWTRVPFYPTSNATYQEILKFIPEDKSLHFIDIGSGFGSLLSYLAKARPNSKFVGVEIGPLPFLISLLRSLLRKNMQVKPKSFWNIDLSKYDIIYAFLAPGPMENLWQKLREEMSPQAKFIVNSFALNHKAQQEVKIVDSKNSVLYVYLKK